MSTITKLGAGKGAVIESVEDYRHQLKRSILMPLHDLRPNEMRSVLAVVTRVSAVKKSQGTDYVLSLQVADPTVGYDSSVLVSIFRRSAETMPDVRGPGDILYLESAKTELFGGHCHLCSNFSTCWQVHHHDTPTDGLHPLLAYLRGWWLARGACDPAALASLPCAASAAALDDSTTTAAANPVAPPAHPPPAGNPKVSNNPPNTCFQTQYFKLIRDFEAGRFGDIIVELVHVEPPVADPFFVGHQMQRCLVTDYTANPLLSLAGDIPAAKRVGGRRLAWCEVHEVDKINKMPALLPSRAYWMRGVRGVQSPAHGLALDVRLHATYQRTILVMEIDDDHPDLEPLKERRRTVLAANDLPPQMPPSLPPLTMHKLSLAERSSAAPAPPSWVAGTAVTPIASIYADQQINVRYHVRARIAGLFPSSADQCMVSVCAACGVRLDAQQRQAACPVCQHPAPATRRECQFALELADDSASCVAMCTDAAAASKLAGGDCGGGQINAVSALLRRIGHPAGGPWADLLVALVLAPGPGPAAGSLTRCLLVSDASALPDSVTST